VVHSFEFDSVTQKHANMLILKDETASLTQGCNAKKRSVGTHQTLVIFSSTSNSILNQFLMKYSLSLHYK